MKGFEIEVIKSLEFLTLSITRISTPYVTRAYNEWETTIFITTKTLKILKHDPTSNWSQSRPNLAWYLRTALDRSLSERHCHTDGPLAPILQNSIVGSSFLRRTSTIVFSPKIGKYLNISLSHHTHTYTNLRF